jgi:hypothetical protein
METEPQDDCKGMSGRLHERRRAPRYRIQLAYRVLISLTKSEAEDTEEMVTLMGYTRDMSLTGLALIVSAKGIEERFLSGTNLQISLVLPLPSGPIEVRAELARYLPLNAEEPEQGQGYLLGVHICEMSNRNRVLYFDYVRGLEESQKS